MVFVLIKTEKFQRPIATPSIEGMKGVARTFVKESKLRQKFSVELSRHFHVFHPQIDVIKATRFHFMILHRIASQFNRVVSANVPLSGGKLSDSDTSALTATIAKRRANSHFPSLNGRAAVGVFMPPRIRPKNRNTRRAISKSRNASNKKPPRGEA
jgi:hypothetical protein